MVPRGLDARDVYPRDGPCQGGGDMTSMEDMHWYDNMHAIGYISLGCFITVSIFLLAATLYYRKKLHNLKHLNLVSQQKPEQKCKSHENDRRQPGGQITGTGSISLQTILMFCIDRIHTMALIIIIFSWRRTV